MKRRMKRIVNAGDRFGYVTVLEEVQRDAHGHRSYRCKCDCGNVFVTTAGNLYSNPNHRCRKCASSLSGKPRENLVGKVFPAWEVLSENGYVGKVFTYKCKCRRCGNISIRNVGQIKARKSALCEKCGPDYHFEINGDTAQGTLPDGTKFLIDTEDVPWVSKKYWHMGKGNYIIGENAERFHRSILGITDSKIFVDHINRDRLDCRKKNLRAVTPRENSYNHSKVSSNRTGYIGVYYSTHSRTYEVKVGYNGKRIYLGSSNDNLQKLAQMYNVAATFLFGDYVGELNDVPPADEWLVKKVQEKCMKYIDTTDNDSFAA